MKIEGYSRFMLDWHRETAGKFSLKPLEWLEWQALERVDAKLPLNVTLRHSLAVNREYDV